MQTMEEKKPKELLTVEEVAKVLKTNERKVGDLLRGHQIIGVKVGREWRVDVTDLNAYIERAKRR